MRPSALACFLSGPCAPGHCTVRQSFVVLLYTLMPSMQARPTGMQARTKR